MAHVLGDGMVCYLINIGGVDILMGPLQVACATDMTLFGYDQGVFSEYSRRLGIGPIFIFL